MTEQHTYTNTYTRTYTCNKWRHDLLGHRQVYPERHVLGLDKCCHSAGWEEGLESDLQPLRSTPGEGGSPAHTPGCGSASPNPVLGEGSHTHFSLSGPRLLTPQGSAEEFWQCWHTHSFPVPSWKSRSVSPSLRSAIRGREKLLAVPVQGRGDAGMRARR